MFTQRFRLFFYSSGYLALYTGFLLIFFMARPADFYPTLRHLLLKSHIVTVVLWLFTCGMLFSIHVIPQLQARIQEGRKTGIVLIGLIALMSFSGFALQIVSSAAAMDYARWLHIITGAAFTALLLIHLVLIKASFRIWIATVLVASLLLAIPFYLLKPKDNFPDEIRLTPGAGTELPGAQKKTP